MNRRRSGGVYELSLLRRHSLACPQWALRKGTYDRRCTGSTRSAAPDEKREESAMRGKIMRVTLALGLLMTALHLAPQYARAEEAMQFNLEKAMTEAKTSAQHETMASYYDRAAITAKAQAEESRKMAEAYRNLAGKGQVRIEGHYRQLVQDY